MAKQNIVSMQLLNGGRIIDMHNYKGHDIDDYFKIVTEQDIYLGYDRIFIPKGTTITNRIDAYTLPEANIKSYETPIAYELSISEFIYHVDALGDDTDG